MSIIQQFFTVYITRQSPPELWGIAQCGFRRWEIERGPAVWAKYLVLTGLYSMGPCSHECAETQWTSWPRAFGARHDHKVASHTPVRTGCRGKGSFFVKDQECYTGWRPVSNWVFLQDILTVYFSQIRGTKGIGNTTAAAAAKSLQSCPTLCDPHRWQPTRLLRPWDSPGKNTGVGCHFTLTTYKRAGAPPRLPDPITNPSMPTLYDYNSVFGGFGKSVFF